MNFLKDFLHQEVPKPGTEIPAYYKRALTISEQLLLVYFLLSNLLFIWITHKFLPVPVAMFVAMILALALTRRTGLRLNLSVFVLIVVAWSGWTVYAFGWGIGAQHLLLPLLVMVFFDIFEPPWVKILFFLGLFAYRMGLFTYSLSHHAIFALDTLQSISLQTLCTVSVFLILACICILFSSNTQATERKLRLDNQELHREAGTDPLTQLPNRRALLDDINRFFRQAPNEPFSVAIADIDFFKSVNDTYGHNCGDYTLKQLAALFRESAEGKYSICRWGGEEFCFFFPEKNLDEAAIYMNDLSARVRKMPLDFEGNHFMITVTVGVAENDFKSSLETILDEADHKLYIGKNSGRDQVVI